MFVRSLRRSVLPVLVALPLAAVFPGCGDPSDEEQVRDTVEAYAAASAKKDYQRICDDLVSRSLAESVESVGLPCELAFKRGLEAVKDPKVQIRKIEVNKARALVQVRSTATGQIPSLDTLELVLERGDWRISSLAKPQPQPPAADGP